ncbi:MAG TPA: DUF4330 domain-containing protein, partial [Candidatus Omnitrophica bacterium]|nr:DUF4330 domain-containing protein [Candidatus Omnitrophota bacterium]
MKIIDEKGRLFGKINIIDFLVIVVFVCILPMFYYGYKIFSKQSTQTVDDPKVFTEIERYCKFIELEPEDLGLIIKGDKEIGEDGNIIGEIVWVGEPESYFYILDLGSGETIIKEDFNLKELLVKLKLRVGIRGGDTVYYKDKRFVVNSPIEFTTDKYSLAVIPKSEGFKFGKTAKKTLMIDLDVVLKGIEEDTLKLISSGDKEVNAEGETIAEILALGKAGSDAREIDLGNGNFVL